MRVAVVCLCHGCVRVVSLPVRPWCSCVVWVDVRACLVQVYGLVNQSSHTALMLEARYVCYRNAVAVVVRSEQAYLRHLQAFLTHFLAPLRAW